MNRKYLTLFLILTLVIGQGVSIIHNFDHAAEIEVSLQEHDTHNHDHEDQNLSCWLCDYAQTINYLYLSNDFNSNIILNQQNAIVFTFQNANLKHHKYKLKNPRSPPVSVA